MAKNSVYFKEKVKYILKNDGTYLLTGFILLTVCLLAITTIFTPGEYSLQLPFSSFFGTVSWGVTIILGIAGIMIFRNIDRKQIALEKIFLIIVIPIGILNCIVRPLGRIPDEDFHARKSMAMAQGNIFSHANENGEATEFLNAKLNELVTRSIENYDDAFERINLEETEDVVEMGYTTMALYAPICHLPQAFGMFITRIFGASVTFQCYAARLMNFAISVFLIYEAIKLIPLMKNVLLFICLLPITIQEIISMSTDALVISLSVFYIAYILYLKYSEKIEKIDKKEITILVISSIAVSLCKLVYLPLCLLLFILPKDKFKSTKARCITICGIIFSAGILNLIWLIYCSRFLIEFNVGVNSGEQTKYILTHPISYIFILFRTMNTFNQGLIVGLCGEGLGVYDVQASGILIYPSLLITSMLFFINDENEKIEVKNVIKIVSLLIFTIIVILINTSLYIEWTTFASPIIYGVQSRYFIPILPLMAIALTNKKIVCKEKLSNRYFLLFILFLNLNVLAITFFTYLKGVGIGVGVI